MRCLPLLFVSLLLASCASKETARDRYEAAYLAHPAEFVVPNDSAKIIWHRIFDLELSAIGPAGRDSVPEKSWSDASEDSYLPAFLDALRSAPTIGMSPPKDPRSPSYSFSREADDDSKRTKGQPPDCSGG